MSLHEERDAVTQSTYAPVARRSYTLDKIPFERDDLNFDSQLRFVVVGKLMRKLKIIKHIGEGGFGEVYLTEDVTVIRKDEIPQKYALKIIKLQERKAIELIQDSLCLIRNIVRESRHLAEVFEDYLFISGTSNILFVVLVSVTQR